MKDRRNWNNIEYEADWMRRKRKRIKMPVLALVFMDILIIGVSLSLFALFNHVIPNVESGDLSLHSGGGTPTPSKVVKTQAPENTANPGDSEELDWGVKFADKFTDGEIIKLTDSYKSKDVSVTVTKVQKDGITYFVQDIYVRNIENIRTAFANDSYGGGLKQNTTKIANNNNAICAINGDYYGARDSGVVIRNGYTYRVKPYADVCILFYDGKMVTYPKENFYVDQIESEGGSIYQAWCFGPSLLDRNGKALSDFRSGVDNDNPRTAIGYYEPGHYCFVVVDGRQKGYSDGISMDGLAKLFEELGCKVAYNLDGGQTSMMTFNGALVNQPFNDGRSCSDIVFICEWEG